MQSSNPLTLTLFLCVLCFCSFSELPLDLWLLADWLDSIRGFYCPALPALSQPNLWRGAAADRTSDRCGDCDQTPVALCCRPSQDSEADSRLWWTVLWWERGGRGRQQRLRWRHTVSCCRLPLLPVSVGHCRPQCQGAMEAGGSVGCCLSPHK